MNDEQKNPGLDEEFVDLSSANFSPSDEAERIAKPTPFTEI
jgi:hypothetical protein